MSVQLEDSVRLNAAAAEEARTDLAQQQSAAEVRPDCDVGGESAGEL